MKQVNGYLPIGTILHNKYKIEEYLSSGGFGNTYLVKDITSEKKFAVKEYYMRDVCQRDDDDKTLKITSSHNENIVFALCSKFKKEALRLQKINSPYIVKVYDLFDENNTSYYVMDYIAGKNLAERLSDRGKPYAEKTVRKFLHQLLNGLQAIHNIGIYHLDLKPSNIMADVYGNLKLIDFGASKQIKSDGQMTTSTAVCYTKGFAPIEQLAQSIEKFGPWTDFYALGAVLYQLATYQNPPTVDALLSDASEDKHLSLPTPGISKEMRELIVWMMSIDRSKRPQSVSEINQRLKTKENKDEHGPLSTSDDTTIIGGIDRSKRPQSVSEINQRLKTTKENKEEHRPLPTSSNDTIIIGGNEEKQDDNDNGVELDRDNPEILNICFYPRVYQLYKSFQIASVLLFVGSLWAAMKSGTPIVAPMFFGLVFIAYSFYIRWMLLHRKPSSILHVKGFLVYELLMTIMCFYNMNSLRGGVLYLIFVIYGCVRLQDNEIDVVFPDEYRNNKVIDYFIVCLPMLCAILLCRV